jgi:hypothetical protein
MAVIPQGPRPLQDSLHVFLQYLSSHVGQRTGALRIRKGVNVEVEYRVRFLWGLAAVKRRSGVCRPRLAVELTCSTSTDSDARNPRFTLRRFHPDAHRAGPIRRMKGAPQRTAALEIGAPFRADFIPSLIASVRVGRSDQFNGQPAPQEKLAGGIGDPSVHIGLPARPVGARIHEGPLQHDVAAPT